MPSSKNQPRPTDDDIKTPLDPTDDAQGMMGDTSGLTGISTDSNDQSTPPHNSGGSPRAISDARYDEITGAAGDEDDEPIPIKTDSLEIDDEDTGLDNLSPDERGEMSVSGDMPHPGSDDDTLENSHSVGLRLDEDSEHPQELNIASDMDKAEEYKRTH